MKTEISFEMKQLALASAVVTLFIAFMYFLLFYSSGMILSVSGTIYALLVWFGFLGANMYREYLKLKKKVAAEMEAEKKLQAEQEEAEKKTKKIRINLLKPVTPVKKSDVIFIAESYNSGELKKLDSYFKFDRILDFPIYKFIHISEEKKQVIYDEGIGSTFKMYAGIYNECVNYKTLCVIVKNIMETMDLIVRCEEEKYKGAEGLLKVFRHYLGQTLKDITKKDLIDYERLERIEMATVQE